ncbi:MAG: c-type cytochrome [Gammaproteobacteria bacterium]|jgi:cytochrome c553
MLFKRVAVSQEIPGVARFFGATLAGAIVTISLALPAFADGNPEQGRRTAETCLGCHGIENYKNVYPTFPVPKLCGQNAQYLTDALRAYTAGDRAHGTMHAQAATLSDKEIQDIAAYFADPAFCYEGK